MILRLSSVCFLTIFPLVAHAGDPAPPAAKASTLAPGSVAPALKPEKWLKGEAVTAFDPAKVYLVECWATWCGPCVAMIPHLNDLHGKFKDQGLVVIGVNVMENDEAKAAEFVARKGDRMAYRVAYDGKTGDIAKNWLEAAGVKGIPHSFLVRGGKVLWHGHPSALSEENVRKVLDGGDLVPAAGNAGGKPDEKLMAYRNVRNDVLGALRNQDADLALAKITENEKILAGAGSADPEVLRGMAYSVKGEKEPSLDHYRKAVAAAKGDSVMLFRVAYGLMDYGTVRDPQLALQCAREAVKSDAQNPAFRHLLARAESSAGNNGEAVKILERLAEDEDNGTYREELRVLKETGKFPESNVRKGGR